MRFSDANSGLKLKGWASIAISITIHVSLVILTSINPLKRVNHQTAITGTVPKLVLNHPNKKSIARQTPHHRRAHAPQDTSRIRHQRKNSKNFSNTPQPLRYQDLLPKEQDIAAISQDVEASKSGNEIASRSADPENEGFSENMRNRNYSEISTFAVDLAQRLFVPLALTEVEPRGVAFARYSRGRIGANWVIEKIKGNPYGRAILFEALTSLRPDSLGIIKLNLSEFQSIRIEFKFVAKSVTRLEAPRPCVHIIGNLISIEVTKEFIDKKWMMLGPGYVNLIGVGLFAYDKLAKNPKVDPEVMRLRQSPVFTHEQ